MSWIWPDGKSQVSIVYEDCKPKRIDTIVISTQHSPDVTLSQETRRCYQQGNKTSLP